MFSKFKFLLLESIKSIGRIKIHSIVSSLAIAVSLIILSLSYCLYTFLSNYKSQITDIYKVEVYFDNNVCKSDLNSSFLDYRMATCLDLPMIEAVIVEVPNPGHPYGVRGVGEVPIVPPMAALSNAITNAIGVRLTKLPMSPDAVFTALDSHKTAKVSP